MGKDLTLSEKAAIKHVYEQYAEVCDMSGLDPGNFKGKVQTDILKKAIQHENPLFKKHLSSAMNRNPKQFAVELARCTVK